MSIGKTIAHKAEAAKGTGKKLLGRATGNTGLQARGHMDQAGGNMKRAQDRAADALGKVSRAMKGSAHRDSATVESPGSETGHRP